jgi:hypothetical protein
MNVYKSEYIVASKQFKYLQLNGGYGHSSNSFGRMDGVFYGAELTPFPWLALLAEHDAADEHYGVRLSTPKHWFSGQQQLSVLGVVSGSNDAMQDNRFYGVSLSFPLGSNQPKARSRPRDGMGKSETATAQTEPAAVAVPGASPAREEPGSVVGRTDIGSAVEAVARAEEGVVPVVTLFQLRDVLVGHGFENVQVGSRGREVVVVIENGIFNVNSIDALGLVAGELARRAPAEFLEYTVVMQRNGINVFSISGDISSYKTFLDEHGGMPADISAQQAPDADVVAGVEWLTTGGKRSWFVPRVTLSPEVETVVGSEVGMLDHTLALNTQFEFPLAKGLSLYASHNTLASNSDDYENGVYAARAKETEWREAYLSQTFVLPQNLTTMFLAGKTSYVNKYYNFVQNETTLDADDGRFQLGVVMGQYNDDADNERWPLLVGSLRYYWAEPDISFKIAAGNFLGQDVGYKVESRHHFGDTQIFIVYRDTDVKMAGMGFSIPLSPRKDMAPVKGFQLKGRPNWSYGLNTVIGETRNPITFGVAEVPLLRNGIAARYYNFDRLSEAYFYRHPERLRDAYYRYH